MNARISEKATAYPEYGAYVMAPLLLASNREEKKYFTYFKRHFLSDEPFDIEPFELSIFKPFKVKFTYRKKISIRIDVFISFGMCNNDSIIIRRTHTRNNQFRRIHLVLPFWEFNRNLLRRISLHF